MQPGADNGGGTGGSATTPGGGGGGGNILQPRSTPADRPSRGGGGGGGLLQQATLYAVSPPHSQGAAAVTSPSSSRQQQSQHVSQPSPLAPPRAVTPPRESQGSSTAAAAAAGTPTAAASRASPGPRLICVSEVVAALVEHDASVGSNGGWDVARVVGILSNVLTQGMWLAVQDGYAAASRDGDELTCAMVRELDTVEGIEACIGALRARGVVWDGRPRLPKGQLLQQAADEEERKKKQTQRQQQPRPSYVTAAPSHPVPHVVGGRRGAGHLLAAALSELCGDVACLPGDGGRVAVVSGGRVVKAAAERHDDAERLRALAAQRRVARDGVRGERAAAADEQRRLEKAEDEEAAAVRSETERAVEELRKAERAALAALAARAGARRAAAEAAAGASQAAAERLGREVACCELAAACEAPEWRAGVRALLEDAERDGGAGGGVRTTSVTPAAAAAAAPAATSPRSPRRKTTSAQAVAAAASSPVSTRKANAPCWDRARSNQSLVFSDGGLTVQPCVTSTSRRHLVFGTTVPRSRVSEYWEVVINGDGGDSTVGVACSGAKLCGMHVGLHPGSAGVYLTPRAGRRAQSRTSGALGEFADGDRLGLQLQVHAGHPARLVCYRFPGGVRSSEVRVTTMTIGLSSDDGSLDWSTFRLVAILVPNVSLTAVPGAKPVVA